MNLETVILLNAILDTIVVSGILALAAWAIRTDRRIERPQVRSLPRREQDRLAA
ncbi:MAG TPA: hypothetical protein VFA19_13020 [Gaiellaceae bacterium]|nr:hypothetical protein [Gaiellaceae bacterium]